MKGEGKLLGSLRSAAEFKARFSQVRPVDELEIIFVQLLADQHPEGARFLGFDVADPQPPFYSLLGDPPPISGIGKLLLRMNDKGLFDDRESADRYLSMVRTWQRPDDFVPAIWHVYSMND